MASPIPTEKRVRVICKSQNEGRGHNPSTESKCMSDMPPTTMVAEFCRILSGRCSRDRKSVSRSSNEAPPNFWGKLDRKCLLQIGAHDEGHSNGAAPGPVFAAHASSVAHGSPTPRPGVSLQPDSLASSGTGACCKIAKTDRNECSFGS